jgi:ABC-2 type transport system permease protein
VVVSALSGAGANPRGGSGGNGLGAGPAAVAARPPAVRHFVRLKLRILGNGMRGRASRKWLFGFGLFAGAYAAGMGALLLGVSAAGGGAQARLLVASFGGAAIVLGSALLPLVWFGVDDSLDPARFALLPVPRRRLLAGQLAAALVGIPAISLLLATCGLLVPGAAGRGGLIAGLLLCVALARAVTSAFATMLRSRRVRDLAGVLLAGLTALISPVQLMVVSAAEDADWDRLAAVAEVIGWTPLAAPYTVGYDVAEGRPAAALAKLLITAVAVAGLLWWWSRSLESAMLGAS